MSSGAFLPSFVIFFTTTAVAGGFPVLVLLHCYKRVPSDNCFAILVIILLGVINFSGRVLIFGEEATSRLSRFIALTSYAELLSLLLQKILFCRVS